MKSVWYGAMLAAFGLIAAACASEIAAPPVATSRAIPTAPRIAAACEPPYPAPPITAETVFCGDPDSMQRGGVLRIVDGDTLHVEIDGVDETVRLYGVDTPERGDRCFNEATETLRALAGDAVRLLPDARNRDRNGRLLRYVYTDAGLSIDAVLVAGGYATAWRDDGNLRGPLIDLELLAQARGDGCIWLAGG